MIGYISTLNAMAPEVDELRAEAALAEALLSKREKPEPCRPATIYRKCECGETAHDHYCGGMWFRCRNCGNERRYRVHCNCTSCKRERGWS